MLKSENFVSFTWKVIFIWNMLHKNHLLNLMLLQTWMTSVKHTHKKKTNY